MLVDVKKVDPVKRELKFKIDKERVSKAMDEVYKDIGKAAKVKGFRPGKVPRHILEKQHGKLAQDEVLKKLIPEVYHEGVQKEKLQPIDMPDIQDVNFKDGVITFTAKLDIKPDVVVKDYKGIKVKRKPSQVTDEELNKTLEYMKQGQGEEKDKEKTVIDDSFARGMGYPNLEEFKNTLRRQMEMEKDRQNRMDVENQIVETLLKKAKLTVPESLVRRQMEHRIQETKNRMKSQGMKEEEFKKKEDDMRKDLKPAVERDVKIYLILDKIAELENMEIKENDNVASKVMEMLLKEAKWEGA